MQILIWIHQTAATPMRALLQTIPTRIIPPRIVAAERPQRKIHHLRQRPAYSMMLTRKWHRTFWPNARWAIFYPNILANWFARVVRCLCAQCCRHTGDRTKRCPLHSKWLRWATLAMERWSLWRPEMMKTIAANCGIVRPSWRIKWPNSMIWDSWDAVAEVSVHKWKCIRMRRHCLPCSNLKVIRAKCEYNIR